MIADGTILQIRVVFGIFIAVRVKLENWLSFRFMHVECEEVKMRREWSGKHHRLIPYV